MTTAPAIALRHLSRSFAGRVVLRDLDLAVAPGETMALVGVNGSGKTTVIEILATVLLPSAGGAAIQGFDVTAQPREVQARVGYAPSSLQSFYPRLNGARNLEFFAALHGLAGRESRRRVAQLLDEFGLADALGLPYERYSDGMKARLVLARALLHDPPVLLLDEPTRSLDPVFRDHAPQLWGLRHDGSRRTVLWVTHDRSELTRADRVIRLEHGALCETGAWESPRLVPGRPVRAAS